MPSRTITTTAQHNLLFSSISFSQISQPSYRNYTCSRPLSTWSCCRWDGSCCVRLPLSGISTLRSPLSISCAQQSGCSILWLSELMSHALLIITVLRFFRLPVDEQVDLRPQSHSDHRNYLIAYQYLTSLQCNNPIYSLSKVYINHNTAIQILQPDNNFQNRAN